MASSVTLTDVQAAAAAITPALARTPCSASHTLSAISGIDVWCKYENLQFTASFKERGALWFLLGLDAAERARGVVAASAGNHAQGVAHHARRLGIAATIVMPAGTPFTKVTRTELLGATVVLHGHDFTAALHHAQQLAQQQGAVFVPAFDDPRVIAGQGPVALEIFEQAPEVDTLVVPVGGGGLIAGCAVVAKSLRPDVRVVGVRSAAPASSTSIAEGIAVEHLGALPSALIHEFVDDIVVVREETIEEAVALYLEIEKVVVEGAGATPLAALLEHRAAFAARHCALVVSGGNIDLRVLSSVILRALARSGRLVRYRLEISDQPGRLAAVAAAIGDAGGNIVDVEHHRDRLGVPLRETILEVSVETRDAVHADAIAVALRAVAPSVAKV